MCGGWFGRGGGHGVSRARPDFTSRCTYLAINLIVSRTGSDNEVFTHIPEVLV